MGCSVSKSLGIRSPRVAPLVQGIPAYIVVGEDTNTGPDRLPSISFVQPATATTMATHERAKKRQIKTNASKETSFGVDVDKRTRLREMNVFVLDNSLRESTVGAIVGHKLEDKFAILGEGSKCKFTHQILAAFSGTRRVDDEMCKQLKERREKRPNFYKDRHFYAFSEVSDVVTDGVMQFGKGYIPIGLQKCEMYSIGNFIIEVDLADKNQEAKFSLDRHVKGTAFLLKWAKKNLPTGSSPQKHFINLRDLPIAMLLCPGRVESFVKAIANLPLDVRPAGLLFEEPTGEFFSEEVGAWTKLIRDTMDSNGWKSKYQEKEAEVDGVLLVHVHRQWGLADSVVLESLAKGADGLWCSVAEEGASMGHSSSTVILANLARLGNTDVTTRYNLKAMSESARNVTEITTNNVVGPRQIVYGPSAIDTVFGFANVAGGAIGTTLNYSSLAEILGVSTGEAPIRLSTLASPGLIVQRLVQCFGHDILFTEEIGAKLLAQMETDLTKNEEYNDSTPLGLAMLWLRAGFDETESMVDVSEHVEPRTPNEIACINTLKEFFLDHLIEGVCLGPGLTSQEAIPPMTKDRFYHAFLQPYFSCFSCESTRFALDKIDINNDDTIEYEEWKAWIMFAMQQFPKDAYDLDSATRTVVRKVIVPRMIEATKGPK